MSEVRQMRAKVRVGSVTPLQEGVQELVRFHGVAKDGGYPEDGLDENNSFARWTPSVDMSFVIANPALIGTFETGDTFYVDFIRAPK